MEVAGRRALKVLCAKALRWDLKARQCEGSPVGEEEQRRAM